MKQTAHPWDKLVSTSDEDYVANAIRAWGFEWSKAPDCSVDLIVCNGGELTYGVWVVCRQISLRVSRRTWKEGLIEGSAFLFIVV